jgi:hypothetical protein
LNLTAAQQEQLRDALLSAFTLEDLKTLVYFKLGADLEDIAGETNRRDAIFKLIRWAIQKERIEELVAGARAENPGNSMLRAFAEQLQSSAPPQQSQPSTSGTHRQRDIYSPYEIAMEELLRRLGPQHPRYTEALVYQARLDENIKAARRYGTKNGAERAEIIDQLNDIALDALGVPFTELK